MILHYLQAVECYGSVKHGVFVIPRTYSIGFLC